MNRGLELFQKGVNAIEQRFSLEEEFEYRNGIPDDIILARFLGNVCAYLGENEFAKAVDFVIDIQASRITDLLWNDLTEGENK